MPIRSRRRPAPASRPPICATSTGPDRRAAARARRAAHASGAALVGRLARANAVEVIGDIELFCRERRAHAPDAPFVAITGTNGKSTTTALIAHLLAAAGVRRPARRQYRHRDPLARAARDGPRACDRVLVLPDRSRALARSVGRHPAQRHRGSSRPPRHDGALRRREGASGRRRPAGRHGDRRRRRQLVRGDRRPARPRRPGDGGARLGAPPAAGRALCRGRADHAGVGRHRAVHRASRRHRLAARRCTTRRTPPARPAPRWRSGCRCRRSQQGLRSFPGLAHRMEQVGRKGTVLFVNDSKATNADSSAQALACFADIFWIAGGKPKTGGISTLTGFFPRIRKAYLIGEAAADFAADARRQGAARDRRHARPRGCARGPRRRGRRRRRAGGAAVAGLRIVRPVPEFRGARRRLPRPGAGAAGDGAGLIAPECVPPLDFIRFAGSNNAQRRRTLRLRQPAACTSGESKRPLRGEFMVSRANARLSPPGGGRSTGCCWRRSLALMLGGIVLSLAASPPVAARLGLEPFYFVNRHVTVPDPGAGGAAGDLVPAARADPAAGARRLRRQPRLGRRDAGLRRRDQGRAALARRSSASTCSRPNSSSPPSSS